MKEWLGIAEAARQLKVAYLAAYNLMLRGELEGRRVGRHWRVKRESVERLVRQRAESEANT